MPYLDTTTRRIKVERTSERIAQKDSDISYLQTCKKRDIIPKGLRIHNPLTNTCNSQFAVDLCKQTSMRLRNHLIHLMYSQRKRLEDTLNSLITEGPAEEQERLRQTARDTRRHLYHKLMTQKNRKLERLVGSSTTPAGPQTTVASNNGTKIVNLSNHILQPAEVDVLSRGLNFCPTTKLDPFTLASDTEEFIRRLRLKEFFHDREHTQSQTTSQPGQYNAKNKESTWTPPEGRNQHLDIYAEALRRTVNAHIIKNERQTKHNITKPQRNAICALKKNRDIVIKSADKGGAIVIQNTTDYCNEAYRQLNNQEHYTPLQADPTKAHSRELNKLIKTFEPHIQETIRPLIPKDPRVGTFYCLPKIHKVNTPGRPIASCNGTLCEDISGYVEVILKPYVQQTPSFCRDTTEFLRKLQTHGPITTDTFLVTMDVSALYTSIPHEDGINVATATLDLHAHASSHHIIQLIRFILEHNVFTFNGSLYQQLHGTAMGSKFAPQYANLFMHHFETDFFTTQTLQPTFYTRYIDDIFLLWPHGEDSLKKLHADINKHHPTLRLTMDYSKERIPFLDTLVYTNNGSIETSLYRKPTDNITFLRHSSFHPRHVKEAIPYGQALRIHRICSQTAERDKHLQILKDALLRSEYDARLIDKQFRRATLQPRALLLNTERTETTPRVPFVTQYFPGAEKLRPIIRNLQHLLDNDDRLSKAVPDSPILAFRQPANLKQLIIRSKLPSQPDMDNTSTTRPCNSILCKTCAIIDPVSTIRRADISHTTHGTYTCNSTGLVYLIRCQKDCENAWYVGETCQTLRQRMNGHRSTINKQDSFLPVGEHFNLPGHSHTDVRVTVLQGNLHDTRTRRITEQKLIAKFRAHSDGLNRDLGFLSRYT